MGSRKLALAVSLASTIFAFSSAALAAEQVGQTTLIVEKVTGQQAEATRRLAVADIVHDSEKIISGPDSAAAILLMDGTELALGADAEVVLDEFVYDKDAGAGKLILNMAVGTMRFATGSMPKPAYEIRTPSAVISVRGTIFTMHVTLAGATFLAVEEGAISVRTAAGEDIDVPTGSTLRLDRAGRSEMGNFRPLGGTDFTDLFDGGLATRKLQIMDRGLREESAREPDQADLTPRLFGLANAAEHGLVDLATYQGNDRGKDGTGNRSQGRAASAGSNSGANSGGSTNGGGISAGGY